MDKFFQMYKELNANNLHLLESVYNSDITFIDPVHEINGLEHLRLYFSALYQNVESISFEFRDIVQQNNSGYLQWDMTFRHKTLARGNPIVVTGTTFLQFNENGQVYYHRDYFDLGAMLYEHLPLLGRIVTTIKRRLVK